MTSWTPSEMLLLASRLNPTSRAFPKTRFVAWPMNTSPKVPTRSLSGEVEMDSFMVTECDLVVAFSPVETTFPPQVRSSPIDVSCI